MASESRGYTRDQTWRILLSAWKVNAVFYSAIGATARAQHWEDYVHLLFFKKQGWVDKPVQSISVSANFEGILPSTVAGVAHRSDAHSDSSEADVRYWAVGGGVKVKIGTGGVGVEPAGPGGATDLLIRAVRATGGATINGENVQCSEVFAQ